MIQRRKLMKKRWISFAALLLVGAMLFVGCGDKTDDTETDADTVKDTEQTTENTEPEVKREFIKINANSNVIAKVSTNKHKAMVTKFKSDLEEKTGITLRMGNTTVAETDFEVLVGKINGREQSAAFYEEISYSECAAAVRDGKLVVGTYTEDMIESALNVILKNVVKENGVWGIWSDFTYNYSEVEIKDTVPKYDTVSGTMIQGVESNGGFQTGYTNTKVAEFDAYCKKLSDNGFTQHATNNVKNNKYATYTKNSTMVHVMWQGELSTCRIVVSSDAYVPEATEPTYTKVKEPTVAQIKLTQCWGMMYVVQFEDGSFLVIDGGLNNGTNKATLLNYLRANKPAGHDKPHVTWIITHPHSDHIELAVSFLQSYSNDIYLDMISYNFPKVEALTWSSSYTTQDTKDYAVNKTMELSVVLREKYKDTKVFVHHTGQKLLMAGAEIEVIFTQEDWWPNSCQTFNDTCSAFKITFDSGKSFFVTADLDEEESDLMAKVYGDYLNCDVFQANHHGQKGGTKNLYQLLTPTYVFWPNSEAKCTTTQGDIYQAPVHHSARDEFNPILFNDPNVLGHFHGEQTTVINMNTMTAIDYDTGRTAESFWPLT